MRRWLAAIFVLGALVAAAWLFHFLGRTPKPISLSPTETPSAAASNSPTPPAFVTPVAPVPSNAPTVPTVAAVVSNTTPISVPAASLVAPPPEVSIPPASVLENMRTVVRAYGSRFGGNPVGTNPEITRALDGGNPGQVKFIPSDSGLRINEKGELVDPWGTPFFFHQLSGKEMEIRSAGPDRKMWTADDLITR